MIADRGRALISAVENGGVAEPSAEMLARLATAYRIDVLDLFRIIGYLHLVSYYQAASATRSPIEPLSNASSVVKSSVRAKKRSADRSR